MLSGYNTFELERVAREIQVDRQNDAQKSRRWARLLRNNRVARKVQ